ncbi:hypothetical protein PEX2_106690 [Penicillium expansum]|uniref:Uncharacterized protein n=1 Tax=Penicillium expansum TaxID=27334 RepID=A0A0A2J2R5_PENEN|nr:hypothetical protein PEX2_106690 [Penicillium expansum]KGO49647.1 hypothetical protein PEX2_106690 [Penicillium expansum]
MAARTLDRMRKAQSLIRECHEWLVQSNEMLLAVELCQIEGRLALFFENRCFANSPCPGLQQEELPRLPPFNGYRRRNRRGSYNGYRRAHPANRSGTEAPASRADGGQNVRAQAAASTSRAKVSGLTCPDADPKPPRARVVVTRPSPPSGVLLDFDNDVEFVQLPQNMVTEMEKSLTADFKSKGKQHLSKWPAPGVSVRVEGDDKSLHQTNATAAHATSAGLDAPAGSYCSPPAEEGVAPVPSQLRLPGSPVSGSPERTSPHTSQTNQGVHEIAENQKGNSMNCEGVPVSTITRGEGMLVDLDENLAVILPIGTEADAGGTTDPEEKAILVASFNSGVEYNLQLEDLEDDEIVFQGNAAKGICSDFKALFVGSDDDSQTARRTIDLKAIFEKYSEVVICR